MELCRHSCIPEFPMDLFKKVREFIMLGRLRKPLVRLAADFILSAFIELRIKVSYGFATRLVR